MAPTYKYNECINQKKIAGMTLIWLDKNISLTADNYYSMNKLCDLIHNIRTFTQIDTFLQHLCSEVNEQIILIVSGYYGSQIISTIHPYSRIDSIYIFCQNIAKHEIWARRYKKIQGVFNDIDLLCLHLKTIKLFRPYYHYKSLKKKSKSNQSSPFTFIEQLIDSDYSYEEVKDEFMSYYTENLALTELGMTSEDCCNNKDEDIDSILIYFSSDDNSGKVDLVNSVEHSNTVTPYVNEVNQKYVDNGVWPHLWWIIKNENNLSKMIALNKIRHLILNINILENIDIYLKLLNNYLNGEHFIVICDLDNLEEYLPLICRQENVRRVYLHISLNYLEKYKTIIQRFSKIISILQYSDTLVHIILQDFTFYLIELARYYQKEKKKNFAKIRYEYALHLQSNIQMFIKEKLQLFDKH